MKRIFLLCITVGTVAAALPSQRQPHAASASQVPASAYGAPYAFHDAAGAIAFGRLYGVSTFADGSRDFILRLSDGTAQPVAESDCTALR